MSRIVYVVTRGKWDSATDAIFDTREAAQAYIDARPTSRLRDEPVNDRIQEWHRFSNVGQALEWLQSEDES